CLFFDAISFCSCWLASASSASRARLGLSTNRKIAAPTTASAIAPNSSGWVAPSVAASRFFARFWGSRLILIIVASLISGRTHRQPDADQRLGRRRCEIRAGERAIDLPLAPRVGDLDRQPRAPLDRAVQRADLRAAAREHDA